VNNSRLLAYRPSSLYFFSSIPVHSSQELQPPFHHHNTISPRHTNAQGHLSCIIATMPESSTTPAPTFAMMINGVLSTPTTTTRTLYRKRTMMRMDDKAAAAPEAVAAASTLLPRRVSLDETHLHPDVLANLIIPSSTSSDDDDDEEYNDRHGDDDDGCGNTKDSHDEGLEDEEEEDILSWVGSRTKRQRLLIPPLQEVLPVKVVAPPVPDEAVLPVGVVRTTERTPEKKHESSPRTTNSCNNVVHHHHHNVDADEGNYYNNKNGKKSATTSVKVANDDDHKTTKKTKAVKKLLRFVAMPTLVGRAAAVDDPTAVWYSRPELAALRNDCRAALIRHGGPKVAAEILRWYNNNDEDYGDDENNDFHSTDDDDDESSASSSSSSSCEATTRKTSQKNIVLSADWMKLRGLERWTSQVLYHVRQMASQTLRSELYICQSSQRCGCSGSCSSGRPSSRLSCPLTEQHPHPLHNHVDVDDDVMPICSCGSENDDAAEQRLAEISRTHSSRAVTWARRLGQWDAAIAANEEHSSETTADGWNQPHV
jgi:hypothetical protein